MKNNKKDFEKNLNIIASMCSPVAKAWIYTFATIGLLIMFIAQAFYYGFNHDKEIAGFIHAIFPTIQFILLTVQQKFNGQNWRTIVKARKDKKLKKSQQK